MSLLIPSALAESCKLSTARIRRLEELPALIDDLEQRLVVHGDRDREFESSAGWVARLQAGWFLRRSHADHAAL